MVGKSEPAHFSFNLSLDTNRWSFLVPATNVRYIGTQCQDTKPAKSLLKSADARKFDNKQLSRDTVPNFQSTSKAAQKLYLCNGVSCSASCGYQYSKGGSCTGEKRVLRPSRYVSKDGGRAICCRITSCVLKSGL